MTFIPARYYHHGRLEDVDVLVLHTAEGARTADELGRYFNHTDRQASSHSGVDESSRVDYVHFDDTAWAAPGANADGEQLEICGFARWSRQEWLEGHPGMLDQVVAWLVERCRARNIPPTFLSPSELRDDRRGITTHAAVSQAFHLSTHTDPGGGFPVDHVIREVRRHLDITRLTPARSAPPAWPGRVLQARDTRHGWEVGTTGRDVLRWQRRMRRRGWQIGPLDGKYGAHCREICIAFQTEKGLHVDGKVGQLTWNTAWQIPIT